MVKLPEMTEAEKTPLVKQLLRIIQELQQQNTLLHHRSKGAATVINDKARQNIYEVLRTKRSFSTMPDEMLRKLILNMKVLRVKKGEEVLKQGEKSASVYLMLKGSVSVWVNHKWLYSLARIGDIFGEMSFINDTTVSATIQADSDLELMVITKDTLRIIGTDDFYYWLCRMISEKLTRTSNTISEQGKPAKPAITDAATAKASDPVKAASAQKTEKPTSAQPSPKNPAAPAATIEATAKANTSPFDELATPTKKSGAAPKAEKIEEMSADEFFTAEVSAEELKEMDKNGGSSEDFFAPPK